jgi:hypothetical protein
MLKVVGENHTEATSQVISRQNSEKLEDAKVTVKKNDATKCVSFGADVSAQRKKSYADATRGAPIK